MKGDSEDDTTNPCARPSIYTVSNAHDVHPNPNPNSFLLCRLSLSLKEYRESSENFQQRRRASHIDESLALSHKSVQSYTSQAGQITHNISVLYAWRIIDYYFLFH